MNPSHQIYLASASPRRKALLTQIGVHFETLAVDVDETIIGNETPREHADRLALAKAAAGWQSHARTLDLPVLGADTIVVIDNTILGKPKNKDDFMRMMRLLSGRSHEVITSVAVVHQEKSACICSISRVTFRPISASEMEHYWNTHEPADKAGGYAIQGKAAVLIAYAEGSFSGITGLPLFETAELLQKFGVQII